MLDSIISKIGWIGFWSGLSTIATLIGFSYAVIWAMSKKRSKDFDEVSKLPLD